MLALPDRDKVGDRSAVETKLKIAPVRVVDADKIIVPEATLVIMLHRMQYHMGRGSGTSMIGMIACKQIIGRVPVIKAKNSRSRRRF